MPEEEVCARVIYIFIYILFYGKESKIRRKMRVRVVVCPGLKCVDEAARWGRYKRRSLQIRARCL